MAFAQKLAAQLKAMMLPFPSYPLPNYPGGRMLTTAFREHLGDERDYTRLVGDGYGNSIVVACVNWIARTFPEAPPAMFDFDAEGQRSRVYQHPMLDLLRFPTKDGDNAPRGYYSGTLLWMATLVSWVLDGNAYWLKRRSAMDRVVQLWYVPHWMMEPAWDGYGKQYITHYNYWINGTIYEIPVTDVVHFRHGLDSENTRKGRSPLKGVLREVYTDEEAARFSASMLKNMGVPGLLISPSQVPGPQWKPAQPEVDAIKAKFKNDVTGDKRGEPVVMTGPTTLAQFGFSPSQMDVSGLRELPEERVTAALGIPVAVVGLGAGLRQTKVGATLAEYRDQAWQSNLIPTQRLMSEEINAQLLPDFEGLSTTREFGFDVSRVKVLQEDQGKQAERWARLVSAGIAKRSEARRAQDLPVTPEDEIYTPQPGVGPEATAPPGASQDQAAQDTRTAQLIEASKAAIIAEIKGQKLDTTPPAPQKTEVHFDKGAIIIANNMPAQKAQAAPTVIIEKGAVQVAPPSLTIEAGAIQSSHSIAEGAIQVNAAGPGNVEITRDANGNVTGARRA